MPDVIEERKTNHFLNAVDESGKIDAEWLKKLCIDAGADDVGIVEIGREALAGQRDEILAAYPKTKTLICVACNLHRESVRSVNRVTANIAFHSVGQRLNRVTSEVLLTLEKMGAWSVSDSWGFPMNVAEKWPGKMWLLEQKPVAVEAGLGKMGHNRNLLHPKFGTYVYLAVILLDREVTTYDRPIDYNPCIDCKMCVAVCPSGAIREDGTFDFASCFTHDYREKLGGFSDWVENIVKSKSVSDYRKRVTDKETVSMWQALTFGGNDKCAYCLAACPAGEYVKDFYEKDKKTFIKEIVRPLQNKEETVYVVPGSDAEEYVKRRFPHKAVKQVANGIRPGSVKSFIFAMPRIFQREQSEGLNATYHFTFTGSEEAEATIVIKDKTIDVKDGLIGKADIQISADSDTWLGFLAKEKSMPWAMITRKIKTKGSPLLFLKFGKCFPS
jgi:NAD-dependent dihydropyrimidine dehydrogenase PreA subunit/putative sterol carrier protein